MSIYGSLFLSNDISCIQTNQTQQKSRFLNLHTCSNLRDPTLMRIIQINSKSMSILEKCCGFSTPVCNNLQELLYDFYRIQFSGHISAKNAIQASGKLVSALNFIFSSTGITQLNLSSMLWCQICAPCPLSLPLSLLMLVHQSALQMSLDSLQALRFIKI